jgi:WD40 repeat protein
MIRLRLICLLLGWFIPAGPLSAQQPGFEMQAGHTSHISWLSFSPDNEFLYSGEQGNASATMWHVRSGKKLRSISPNRHMQDSLLFGYKKMTPDTSGDVNFWYGTKVRGTKLLETKDTLYIATRHSIKALYHKNGKIASRMLYYHGMSREYRLLIQAGEKLISADDHGNVIITDLKGGHLRVFSFSKIPVTVLRASNNKQLLAVGNVNGQVFTIDLNNSKVITEYKGLNKRITRLDYSNDGNTLYITKEDEVLTYNFKTNVSKKLYLPNKISDVKIDTIIKDSLVLLKYVSGYLFNGRWNLSNNSFNAREIIFVKKGDMTVGSYTPTLRQDSAEFNGQTFVKTGSVLLIKKQGAPDTTVSFGNSNITAIKVNKIYNYISVATLDGKIHHYHLATKQHLFSSLVLNPLIYMHVLPNGYYFASKHVFKFVNCVRGNKFIPAHQVDAQFNRPDQLIDYIPQLDPVVAEAIKSSYAKRSVSREQAFLPGILSEVALSAERSGLEKGMLGLEMKATSDRAPVVKIHLMVNGVEEEIVQVSQGKNIAVSYTVELSAGENQIEIFAEDSLKNFSNKVTIFETYQTRVKPQLYLVCLGSGRFEQSKYNLNYAAKDAHDILQLFSTLNNYSKINRLEFLNENVRRSNVEEIKKFLETAGKRDYVVLFYAGHGILDKDMDYYLSAYGVDFMNPKAQGIEYAQLEDVLRNCRSRQKLFLIDACHSGDIDKGASKATSAAVQQFTGEVVFRSASTGNTISQNELSILLSKELFASGSNNSGISIIGASMGSQLALESNQWNNGVFTKALLSGLGTRGKRAGADYNHDRKVMLNELQFFVYKKVEELTNGRQKPTTRKENLISNMRLR